MPLFAIPYDFYNTHIQSLAPFYHSMGLYPLFAIPYDFYGLTYIYPPFFHLYNKYNTFITHYNIDFKMWTLCKCLLVSLELSQQKITFI